MIKKYFQYTIYFLFLVNCVFSQNPTNINLNSVPTNYAVDSYTRATTKINLQPGFKFEPSTNNSNKLLNLSIGTYPSFVSPAYQDTLPANNVITINPNLELATTEGSGNVLPNGSFNYQFPIFCSPGMASTQPNLSVSYNSNSGISILGLGFSLSGISAIGRTNKTKFYDGVNSEIKLNNSDVFALDGERMLLKTGTYGQNGATYKMEVENYNKMISIGNLGSPLSSFIVYTPDGKTIEYGNTNDSKLKAANNNEILAWYVNKVIDEFGNYMTFHYSNQNGELLIEHVEYSGNASAGLSPYNKIYFEYIDRSDKRITYYGGGEFNQTKLLKSITCNDANNTLVRKYIFQYQYSNMSLLKSITELDANQNQLNPTYIDWKKINKNNNNSNSYSLNSSSILADSAKIMYATSGFTQYPTILNSSNSDNLATISVDFNGDGKKDLLSLNSKESPYINFYYPLPTTYDVFLSTASSNNGQTNDFQKVTNTNLFNTQQIAVGKINLLGSNVYDEDDDNYEEVFLTVALGSNQYLTYKIKFDGTNYSLTNLHPPKTISQNNSFISNWHNNFGGFQNFRSNLTNRSSYGTIKVDITGDNLLDEIIFGQEEITITPSNNQPAFVYPISDNIKIKVGDFDGDGIVELYRLKTSSNIIPNCFIPFTLSNCDVEILKYNSQTNNLTVYKTKSIINNIIFPINTNNCSDDLNSFFKNISSNVDFSDFNGDGKTDILFNKFQSNYIGINNPGNADLMVSFSDGINFLNEVQLQNIQTKYNSNDLSFFAGDLNNDGQTDWCASGFDATNFIAHFLIHEGNGEKINPVPIVYSKATKYASCMGDFDGNGSVDYLSQNALTSPPTIDYNVFNRNNSRFIKKIYNIKTEYNVDFSLLTDFKSENNFPLYKKGGTAPANFSITKMPMYVVASTNFNGKEKKFYYENSFLHRQGKGLLGFEKFYTFDVNIPTGIVTVLSHTFDTSQDYLKSSSLTSAFTFLIPNTFIQLSPINTFSKETTALNYVTTGSNRYLNDVTTNSLDYSKSINSNGQIFFDPNKDGNPISKTQFSTPWANSAIHTIENANQFTYQVITNPINGQPNYKPLKIINTKSSNNGSGIFSSVFHTDFVYDNAAHLITKIENSNLPNLDVTTSYSNFDSFGNSKNVVLNAPDLTSPKTSLYLFDNTGRFLLKSTNSLGYYEEYTYETRYGNQTSKKDITGQITSFNYDGLGRLIKTITPTGAVNTVKYEWYSYTSPFNSSITNYSGKITTSPEGMPQSIKKYDINNNLVESIIQVFGGNNKTTLYTYNIIGQLLKEKEIASVNPLSGDKEVNYTYDNIQRPDIVNYKIGNNTINTINYFYSNWSITGYNKGFVETKTKNNNSNQFNFVRKENNEAGQIDVIKNYSSQNPTNQNISTSKFNEFNLAYNISNTFGASSPIITTINYDALGRKQQLTDPSSGISTYAYNSIGEIINETSPNGNFNFQYDVLGRLQSKTSVNNGYNYTYQYYTSGNGKQQLEKVIGPNETTEYKYDAFNRPIEKKQTLITSGNKIFKFNYTYNKYNQLVDYTFPSGFTTKKEYDAIGNLVKIKASNTVIWELNTMYTPNLIEGYTTGNGLFSNNIIYDPNQNLSQKNFGSLKQQNYFLASENGNVLQRSTSNFIGNNEQFEYDNFDRLTNSKYIDNAFTLQTKANVTYNSNGNINSKSDAGNYAYTSNANPYQLTAINNPVGNLSLNTLNIIYNDFKKVQQITEATSNKEFNFVYGNDEQRVKMDYKINGINQYTRYYTDNYDLQENANGSFKEWNYINTPTGMGAIYFNNNGSPQLLYTETDHLGSPVLITNAAGVVLEEYSFDAWGRRRNPLDWNDYTTNINSNYLIRGYTGHEHLNEVGIINMNGRIYDPVLGRFLQPDPYVQDIYNLQNYNRYSYTLNNPLKYFDLSGYDYGTTYIASAVTYNYSTMSVQYTTYVIPTYNAGYAYNYNSFSGYASAPYVAYTTNSNGMTSTSFGAVYASGGTGFSGNNVNTNINFGYSGTETGYNNGNYYSNTFNYSQSYNYSGGIPVQTTSGNADNLGLALSITDVGAGFYTGYLHNYDTYISTSGQELSFRLPNGALRTTQQAQMYMTFNTTLKGIGTTASILSTAYSGYKVVNGSATTMDRVDFGVGLTGLGAGVGTSLGVISNPVGWTIGVATAIYGGTRLLGDLIGNYNPSGHGVGQYYDYGTGLYMIK